MPRSTSTRRSRRCPSRARSPSRWADRRGSPPREEPRPRHRRPSSAGAASPTPLPGPSATEHARRLIPLVVPVRPGHRRRRPGGSAARRRSSVRATLGVDDGRSPGRDLGPGPRPRGNSGPRRLLTRRSVALNTTWVGSRFRQAVPTNMWSQYNEGHANDRRESRPAGGERLRRRHPGLPRHHGAGVRGGVEHRTRRRPAVGRCAAEPRRHRTRRRRRAVLGRRIRGAHARRHRLQHRERLRAALASVGEGPGRAQPAPQGGARPASRSR